MALDIGGWLKRLITLPKAKNSLSDILGEDRSDLVKELAKPLVEDVLSQALDFVGAGLGGAFLAADRTSKRLVAEVERLLGREVSRKLEDEIWQALSDAARSVPNDPEKVRAALERGIWKALGLS